MSSQLGLISGTKEFKTAEEFLTALDNSMKRAIQQAKIRLLNYIDSPGPNRGYLFPKDTHALIDSGLLLTQEGTQGGLKFTYTYGFAVPYTTYVNKMDWVTQLGLYHYRFYEKKLADVIRFLEEEIKAVLSQDGWSFKLDFSNLRAEAEALVP